MTSQLHHYWWQELSFQLSHSGEGCVIAVNHQGFYCPAAVQVCVGASPS